MSTKPQSNKDKMEAQIKAHNIAAGIVKREIADEANKTVDADGEVRDFDGCVANSYLNKRRDAKKRNLDFGLSLRDVARILKAKKCYFTGVPLRWDSTDISEKITFDRINSSIGYVPGNVVPCSLTFNQMKAFVEGDVGRNHDELLAQFKRVAVGLSKVIKAF